MGDAASSVLKRKEAVPAPDGDPENLSLDDQTLVGRLVATNFKGFAETKLRRLKPHIVARLAKLSLAPSELLPPSFDEQIEVLLGAKRERARASTVAGKEEVLDAAAPPPESPSKAAPEAAPPPPTKAPSPNETPAPRPKSGRTQLRPVPKFPPAPQAPGAPGAPGAAPAPGSEQPLDASPKTSSPAAGAARTSTKPAFRAASQLRVVAFNALKLRVDKEALEDAWDATVRVFADYDVVMLTEVPSGAKLFDKRVSALFAKLNAAQGHEWTLTASEPSGGSEKDRASEVHVVLVRKPFYLAGNQITHHDIGGVAMGHAPFTVVIGADHLSVSKRFALTSVHLPPNSNKQRREARDLQAAKLFEAYADVVRRRLDLPFTLKGARDARVAPVPHIIAGDFNADAASLEALGADDARGWRIGLGPHIGTSAGGKAYDNFVVSKQTTFGIFALSFSVLTPVDFAKWSKREDGVSDHSAVALVLTEVDSGTRTSSKKKIAEHPSVDPSVRPSVKDAS